MAHLEIEEIAAFVNGEPAGSAFAEHRSACAVCDNDVRQWQAIGNGVRLAAPYAEQPAPARPLSNVLTAVKPRPAVRRRYWLPVSGAVAAALLAAALLIGSVGGGRQDMTETALVSTDCPTLKVAAGELVSMSATGLVLRTASGKEVKVTTGGSPAIVQQVAGTGADVTDGVSVMARGEGTANGEQVTATQIALLPKEMNLSKLQNGGRFGDLTRMMASRGNASGKVSDVHSGGFTVTGANGTRVSVVTSDTTTVIKQREGVLADLVIGAYTVVVGTPTGDAGLDAKNISQNTLDRGAEPNRRIDGMPRDLMPSGAPRGLSGKNFSGLGCDAGAIANTATFGLTS